MLLCVRCKETCRDIDVQRYTSTGDHQVWELELQNVYGSDQHLDPLRKILSYFVPHYLASLAKERCQGVVSAKTAKQRTFRDLFYSRD